MPRVTIGEDGLVRRPAYPWTATLHHLLRHLLDQGLEVPEPVALEIGPPLADGAAIGTEIVRLVPGVAGADVWPLQASDAGLCSAAVLLRAVHDAARTFEPPPDAIWPFPPVAGAARTILHGDPGPWNLAWRGGIAVGVFDWDLARPGAALDDVAYALDYLAPLRDDADCLRWHGFAEVPDRAARARAFLDAYGLDLTSDELVGAVLVRKRRTLSEVARLAAQGMEPQRTWVAEGYLRTGAEHLAWAETNAARLLT